MGRVRRLTANQRPPQRTRAIRQTEPNTEGEPFRGAKKREPRREKTRHPSRGANAEERGRGRKE